MKVDDYEYGYTKDGYYQLLLPVLISKKLNINYKKILEKKNFQIVSSNQSASDLLYFDVVYDTYKNGFTHYQLSNASEYRFYINKANYEECIPPYRFIDMGVKDVSILIRNSYDKNINTDTVYFSILLKEDKVLRGRNKQILPKDAIIATISQYASSYLGEQTTSSYLASDTSRIWLFHGNGNKNTILDNRFDSIYRFFEISEYYHDLSLKEEYKIETEQRIQHAKQHREKFGTKINFVNGKNIFVNYYIRDDEYFKRVKTGIENVEDLDHMIINNIHETKYESNVYVKDIEKIVEQTFFLKWKDSGAIYTVSSNSFGVIVNTSSSVMPQIIFEKYNMAIFFALNQRVMNIELQESVKGIAKNSYRKIKEHYVILEKFAFYEISGEEQINTLFDMLQLKFKNPELTTTIMSEMEIHQSRRLNETFERLTKYGIYLTVLGIVISSGSYFATFQAESHRMPKIYEMISMVFANPFTIFFAAVIFFVTTIIFLERQSKK